MKAIRQFFWLVPILAVIFWVAGSAVAQSPTFNFQGNLTSGGTPANGVFDFEVALFDAVSGGTQLGSNVNFTTQVTNGIFFIPLNFGPQFPGAARFIEIRVRPQGGGAFTALTPRQQINSTPYSIKSLSSDTATNATQLGGIASTGFLQNTASPQAATFNINGTGTANIFNAGTQFNIAGARVLSVTGTENTFVGVNAGAANTATSNSFFGNDAGKSNTTGTQNAFFGSDAGQANTTGSQNSFFGNNAGFANQASGNSYFGAFAGDETTSGANNSFFGNAAGGTNTIGSLNAYFGRQAGLFNGAGERNAFFGAMAGRTSGYGSDNTHIGFNSGWNGGGDFTTLVGVNAIAIGGSIQNSTAIGADAQVEQSNSLVLGSINGVNGATANTRVGIGTTTPDSLLEIVDRSAFGPLMITNYFNSSSTSAKLLGRKSRGTETTPGAVLADDFFFGIGGSGDDGTGVDQSLPALITFGAAENWNTTNHGSKIKFFTSANGQRNSFSKMVLDHNGNFGLAEGNFSPEKHLHIRGTGDQEIMIESSDTGGRKWTLQSSDGAASGRFEIIDRTAGANRFTILPDGRVGIGTVAPGDKLHVNGILRVSTLGTAGSNHLCINANDQIASCSSSIRYKTKVGSFRSGLSVIDRLRPVSFRWRDGGAPDLGLVAEEVAKVEPLLTTTNDKGEVEGVKYDRIGVVLINAVKEQQAEIDLLQKENTSLRDQLLKLREEVRSTLNEVRKLKKTNASPASRPRVRK